MFVPFGPKEGGATRSVNPIHFQEGISKLINYFLPIKMLKSKIHEWSLLGLLTRR